jgi:hypothetical protein
MPLLLALLLIPLLVIVLIPVSLVQRIRRGHRQPQHRVACAASRPQTQRRLEDLKPPAHRWPTSLSRRTAFGAPGAYRLPQACMSAQAVPTASQ